MSAAEEEAAKNKDIIAQYKDICSKMSERIERNNTNSREEVNFYKVCFWARLLLSMMRQLLSERLTVNDQ